jgi:hypothetical protein
MTQESRNACVLYSGRARFESLQEPGLSWGFRDFTQSLYVNTGIVTQISHGLASYDILYNLFSQYYAITQWYVVSVTNSMIK